MGVYIKGLEMPKKCINCRFCVYMNEYPFLACFITYSGIPLDADRLLNCPLAGIKTPHGRLIDEDELIDDLIEQKIPFNARINESIIITPTILEAEEK